MVNEGRPEVLILQSSTMAMILVMLKLHLKELGYIHYQGKNLDLEVKVIPMVL